VSTVENSNLESDKEDDYALLQNKDSILLEGLSPFFEGSEVEWNRFKIMICGTGRAGKTALSRNMIGESFNEHLESTIGINGFEVNVNEVGSDLSKKGELGGLDGNWKKYEEKIKLLEGAVVKSMMQEAEVDKKRKEETRKKTEVPNPSKSASIQIINSSVLTVGKTENRLNDSSYPVLQNELSAAAFFDEKDYEKKITKNDLDLETVKCLAENVTLRQSKYILSIYDYGGQEVFNAIHPFFLTKYGLYVVVFDMRQLVKSADEKEKEECLKNLRFWLNSVSLHSYDEGRKEMAPIILVGTRKDIVISPEDHEEISKVLSCNFGKHSCWNFLISNRHGLGKKGNTTFCYFPVSNKMRYEEDATVVEFMTEMENAIVSSHFMQKKLPLVWLQVMDKMKERADGGCYLKYEKALSIAKECGMSEKSIPYLLKFMHEMGLAMWHEEVSLSDVIVLDAVKYFVTPATTIICKHVQREDDQDATWHLLPIHEECRKAYSDDWEMMLQYGLVSEQLLDGLLSGFPQKENVKRLMLCYGLLLNLHGENNQVTTTSLISSNTLFRTGYLVPSLFNPTYEKTSNEDKLRGTDCMNSFYLGFYVSKLLEVGTFVDSSEIRSKGFLPNGFFERLLCKMINVCLNDSPSQAAEWSNNIRKGSILLLYKGQKFRLTSLLLVNMIEVDVFGYNPVPIYFLLSENIETVCEESYHSLKCMTLLSFKLDSNSSEHETQFIKLDALQQCIAEISSFSLPSGVSVAQLKEDYNVWFFGYKQTLALTGYDIFLSYRWNAQDSALVKCLFHEFSYYNLSSERYSPISVFLDGRRLQDGEDFRESFVSSLLQSKIVVPIVTVEALKRMIHHNPAQIDNLLLEWILALHFSESSSSGLRVIPIVFGSYSLLENKNIMVLGDSDSTKKIIKEIKGINDPHSFSLRIPHPGGRLEAVEYNDVDIVNTLTSSFSAEKKRIVPDLTLVTADTLLKKNGQKGLSEEMKNRSIDQIVSKLLLFQGIFLSSGDLPSSRYLLKELAQKQVERLMHTLVIVNRESSCQHPLTTDSDYFFYNQKKVTLDAISSSSNSCNRDYDKAFACLEPKMSVVPKLWSSLLAELGIEEPNDLKNRNHCLTGLAGLLHEVPFANFCAALQLDTGSFDIKLDVTVEKVEAAYSILSQPKKSSCPKCWKSLLEELSIEEANDLLDVEPTVLCGLVGLLKSTQAKVVRTLFDI
jgi:GTPase SAR1 family protein